MTNLTTDEVSELKSLRGKIIAVICGLILLFGSTLGSILYFSSKALVVNSVSTQAKTIAEKAVQEINEDDFAKVVDCIQANRGQSEILQMREYRKIRQKLAYLKALNGLKYLYTMTKRDDGKFIYVVDGFPLSYNGEELSKPGDVEDETFPGLTAVFKTGKTQVGDMAKSQKYGALISVFVPINQNGQMIGMMGADFNATQIDRLIDANRNRSIALICIFLLAAILLGFLLTSLIVRPVPNLLHTINLASQGDLTVKAPIMSKDEIGQLSAAFNDMVSEQKNSVQQVLHSVNQVENVTKQLTTGNEELSARTIEQANALEKIAKTMNEVNQSIQHIDANSQKARQVSENTLLTVHKGEQLTSETIQAMSRLTQSSHEIKEITKWVYDIAFQINLLALNAAIEAARAGEQGRGFAVVAHEVRSLAAKSTEAVKTIEHLIQDSIQRAEESDQLVGQFAEVLKAIVESTELTSHMIHEVAHSIGEHSEASTHINMALDEIQRVNEEHVALSEELSASSETLDLQTVHLKQAVQQFQVK